MSEHNKLKEIIEIFVDRWDSTEGVWRNEFANTDLSYKEYKLVVSYGKGIRLKPPKYPWVTFLKNGYKVQQGIYPNIEYVYDEDILRTGLGSSNNNIANVGKEILKQIDSYKGSEFKTANINELIDKLNENMKDFDRIISDTNVNIEKINLGKQTMKNNKNFIKIKNIILYGSPGVGKTHNYQNIILMIENKESDKYIFDTITKNQKIELNQDNFKKIKNDNRVKFITFHQNYSYEDFIEGFRPNENGNIKLEDGIFKQLSNQASKQQDKNFYLIIDEINRGNISKIFGELITLIEEDKRDDYEITLPYSKNTFKIPSNLYIIGTMNSTDKSIATIDIALRRRFTFLKMLPNLELVENEEARELMEKLNIYIKKKLGEDYMLGHSYFMKIESDDDLKFVKQYKIKPLLEEYFYADDKTPDEIINEALNDNKT